MRIGKHLPGVTLFFIILGSMISLTGYLTALSGIVRTVAFDARPSTRAAAADRLPVNYSVDYVSLDFINRKSYTTLTLRREPGQPAPQSVWVRTYFIRPEDGPQSALPSAAIEIREPFAEANRVTYTLPGDCVRCEEPGAAKSSYYARVAVSTAGPEETGLSGVKLTYDIRTAIPVLVQAPRMTAALMPGVRPFRQF
ncbi:MAG TPA: hypothetical protein VF723_09400 [Pyrinomonadaceae bacterium]|jgi:hypothetical protein